MDPDQAPATGATRLRKLCLAGLLAALAPSCLAIAVMLKLQPAGIDYSPLWAGARTVLHDPSRLYDFHYITALQGWPLQEHLRPFIYPPSSLLLFAPLAGLPYWISYGVWVAATAAVFVWAGRRLGAPLWLMLFPVFWLVVYCGQTTFLIAALVMIALASSNRPVLSGVLLGAAAAIKPQMALFLPLALLAAGQWRTLATAGLTGALAGLGAIALWGAAPWFDWIDAMGRFKNDVLFASPGLVEDMITPYALLTRLGLPGALAWALAPLAAVYVWRTFRRTPDPVDRTIAVFGAALLVSPYAMHYEAALLLPGVAAYLARLDDRRWPLYVVAAAIFTTTTSLTPVLAALALPMTARIAPQGPPLFDTRTLTTARIAGWLGRRA